MRIVALAALSLVSTMTAGDRRPITFDDFAAIGVVSDPQVSPDGRQVLFTVTGVTWRIATFGGVAHRFPDDQTKATEARWSPDGQRVAYIAGGQLWIANAGGASRHQVTRLTGEATGPRWSSDGRHIAFISRVGQANAVNVHVAEQLLYRHWDAWDDGTRAHVFVIAPDGGTPTDLTPGAPYDVLPGGYAFSPEGHELAFSAKGEGASDAWTTNVDVWTAPVIGGRANNITSDNKGADQNPTYSPDGRFIVYQSQAHAGYESDRWRLMRYDRATSHATELLPSWDRSADAYEFTPDGALLINTVDAGHRRVYRVPSSGGTPALLLAEHDNDAVTVSADGHTLVWLQDAADHPPEVYEGVLSSGGVAQVRQLSHVNDALLSHLALRPAEEFWFTGAICDSVQGFIIKPPQWEPRKTFPAVVLIHGGPHGAWLDSWYRYNYQMFAARGFGVIAINPRGSPGYGRKFSDAVATDWGGKVYTDLMDGIDSALVRAPWIDSTRLAAFGASYGGYMVNFIAGHTDRFKALVSHAGPFNLESFYGATDELWFPEWEFGGPFWDSTAMATQYRLYSPHLYAKNFKTPTLVLHGERDYRVPYTEGLSMFTALQRQGVPSRLVVFPDEGHWIVQPRDQRLWWSEVQGWLTRYLAPEARHANRESLDDAWWTGSVQAASAATLPAGHLLFEPYFYDVIAAHSNTLTSRSYLIYGLVDRFAVGVIPILGYSSAVGFEDLTAQAQFRLTQFHPGSWAPTTSVLVQETFPTGKYDRLGDRPSNGLGAGAYTTTLALYSQTYFWLPNGRILRARLDLQQAVYSSPVSVADVSVYGTGPGFRGQAAPGLSTFVDASGEYSLTQRWVLALDANYGWNADTRVTGGSVRLHSGVSEAVGFTPAIEYNWNASVGVIGGVRVLEIGRNTVSSITPVIAINVVH